MTPRLAVARRRDDVDLERDRALVERCQAGDKSAFDDLYLRYYSRLCRFCFRRLGDIAEAEDTAQEAFARAWKAMPTFNGERRFYPWLSVIASHLCVDSIRRNTRTTPVGAEELDLVVNPVDGGQEAVIEQQDDRALLYQAMGRISPRHREVLQLREGYEWTYQQIAEHQGVQVSTIETLLFRARRSLRREFLILAEGQAGLAGFLLILRKLVWKSRLRLGPLGSKAIGSQAVPTGGASIAGAGASGGAVPAAAGLLATAVAAAGVTMAASFAPHAALAGAAPVVSHVSKAAVTAGALLPLASTHVTAGHSPPASRSVSGQAVRLSARQTKPATAVATTVPHTLTGANAHPLRHMLSGGASKVAAVLHTVTSTVQALLANPVGTLQKTVQTVAGIVPKLVKTVNKTVSGLLGAQNPLSGLLNGLVGGNSSSGNTGSGGLLGGLGL